jgi:hypothetical protein
VGAAEVAGRDFLMPWNIAKEFWPLLDKPARRATAFSVQCRADRRVCREVQRRARCAAVSIEARRAGYLHQQPPGVSKGRQSVSALPARDKGPFAILINYGAAKLDAAAWQLLNGELKDQFLVLFPVRVSATCGTSHPRS